MTTRLNVIQHNRLSLNLRPIFVGQLFIMDSLENPGFHYSQGKFIKVLDAEEGITTEFISTFAKNFGSEIFIFDDDLKEISNRLRRELTKLTRSLSIGDVKKNVIKHTNFLNMQMHNLYQDPFNDEVLNSQFQNSKNLSLLLMKNKDIHKSIFHKVMNSNYHYTCLQPLSSSILLLSFLQFSQLFSEKEMEGLFLTSYFKDIGMSFIPREKFELANLDEFDQQLFAKHSDNSMLLLEDRVPLSPSQLNLIKNHHFLNYKIQALIGNGEIPSDGTYLTGVESMLVSATDILVAMISKRPYREPISSYKALELLKRVISDEYPQEFKALVVFLKNFLSR